MLTKDKAICIRALDYSETSQILTFFTQQAGKVSAIAKGSKRPKSSFGGPIELLAYGEIVFSYSAAEKLDTLTEFEQKLHFNYLSRNLLNMNCSLFAVELVNSLTSEHDPHPALFDNLLSLLKNFEQAADKADALRLLILFQLALLREVGLQPVLDICVNCKAAFSKAWQETFFSSSANGLICRDCEASFPDKIRLTNNAAMCLYDFKAIVRANEIIVTELEWLLVRHFTELLHKPPKMARYVV